MALIRWFIPIIKGRIKKREPVQFFTSQDEPFMTSDNEEFYVLT